MNLTKLQASITNLTQWVKDGLSKKADAAATTQALNTKANQSDLNTTNNAVNQKANSSDVTTALAAKANSSDVNTALASKANQSDLNTTNTAVISKASQSSLDATNQNLSNLSTVVGQKADATATTNALNTKQSKVLVGTSDPAAGQGVDGDVFLVVDP